MNYRSLVAAAGCGTLLVVPYSVDFLKPEHIALYTLRFPITSVFAGILIDLAGISLAAAVAILLLQRLRDTSILWPVVLTSVFFLEQRGVLTMLQGLRIGTRAQVGSTLGVLLFSVALRTWKRPLFSRMIRLCMTSLAVWGFSIFWLVPEVSYLAVQTSRVEPPNFSRSSTTSSGRGETVAWIIFDELSYDQLFEHRWSGLQLPNFDRLRAESITFSKVQPAGYYTRIAVLSMFLGRPASQMTVSATGVPSLYMDDSKRWEQFDAGKTIFADARKLGFGSGIVGWFNPYCRFMQNWVDECQWVPFPNDTPHYLNPQQSILANAATLPLRWFYHVIPAEDTEGREWAATSLRERIREYDLLMKDAQALILDRSVRFKFIHLPLPHPSAIYNRATMRFSSQGSYVDNLALADKALGELLDSLEKTPEWRETTLVVCGDHSWRTSLWRNYHSMYNFWSSEDAAASRGVFDTRPALLIHLPGQRNSSSFAREFRAVRLADLLLTIMRGGIRNSDDVMTQLQPALSTSYNARVVPKVAASLQAASGAGR